MKTDILVIGGGLAGLRCAQEAAKSCGVLLISGGNGASPYIHGVNVPLHKDDSAELFEEDTLKSGRYQNDRRLVRVLCENSLSLAEEFSFDKSGGEYSLLKPLGSSLPRVASINEKTGLGIIKGINENRRFSELKNTRAMRLLRNNGKVCGARCFDIAKKQWFNIYAKATVLATGGFAGIYPFSTNSPDIGGDGIAMAFDAGAELCDMEFIQFEPTAAVSPRRIRGKSVITTMLYEGAVMRNCRRERFMDERVNKDELSLGIFREILSGNGTADGGVFYDMTGVDEKLLLTKYKDYFKRYADCGIDIRKEYAEIAPAPHTALGGVVTDERCRTRVDGLFACGEVTGGLHGANRLGGNAGLETLIFGKIAGRSAAEYALRVAGECFEDEETADDKAFDDTADRSGLEKLLESSLNVIRCEKDMKELLSYAKALVSKLKDAGESYSARRLYNDAYTAYLAALSAMERKESVGCHIRSDGEVAKERYRIILKNDRGNVSAEKQPII